MRVRRSTASIVVGTDGSDQARRAVRWAAAEACLRQVPLDVVHAWMPPLPINPQDLFIDCGPLEDAERAVLHRIVAQLNETGAGSNEVRPVLVMNDAATALVEAASDAQLLVVGSRGHGGFAGLRLGSVSRKCLHRAPCPVAVVPAGWSPQDHRRIVVGVDGSEGSRHTLRWAIDAAARHAVHLDVLNVWSWAEVLVSAGPAMSFGVDAAREASESLLAELARSVIADARPSPTHVELRPVAGAPAATLVEAAGSADLLVVGARRAAGPSCSRWDR